MASRRFTVDPRRRYGRNGGARRLLANDGEAVSARHGAWAGLVSALQRHTVHGELSQLSKEDRQILSMAYLYGHTNREIAQMLEVSVSTVRRRLSMALSRLEESMRRAGLWISLVAVGAMTLYSRMAHSTRARLPATVAAVAAGTATAVTLGVVAVGPAVAPATAGPRPHHAGPTDGFLPAGGGATIVLATTRTPARAAVKPRVHLASTDGEATGDNETGDDSGADTQDETSDGGRPTTTGRGGTQAHHPHPGALDRHSV